MAIKILPKLLERDSSNRIITGNISVSNICTEAQLIASIGGMQGYLDGQGDLYFPTTAKDALLAQLRYAYEHAVEYTIPYYDIMTSFKASTSNTELTDLFGDTCIGFQFLHVTNNSGQTLKNQSDFDLTASLQKIAAIFDDPPTYAGRIYAYDLDYVQNRRDIADGDSWYEFIEQTDEGNASTTISNNISALGGSGVLYNRSLTSSGRWLKWQAA